MNSIISSNQVIENAAIIANATMAVLGRISDNKLSPNAAVIALHVMKKSLEAGYIGAYVDIPVVEFSELLGIKTPIYTRNYINEAVEVGVLERIINAGLPSSYILATSYVSQ